MIELVHIYVLRRAKDSVYNRQCCDQDAMVKKLYRKNAKESSRWYNYRAAFIGHLQLGKGYSMTFEETIRRRVPRIEW
jgi:hypothetical protein